MALVVWCPACRREVAGRDLPRDRAEWAARDHESEHEEAMEDERNDWLRDIAA